MSPFARQIWKELRQRSGPSDTMPTVERTAFSAGTNASNVQVEAAISELVGDGALAALTDKELAGLSTYKRLPGDFLIWVKPEGDWAFLRVLTPTEVQRASAAKRALLRRKMQQAGEELVTLHGELRALEEVLGAYQQSPIRGSRSLWPWLNSYAGVSWSEAVEAAQVGGNVGHDEVAQAISSEEWDKCKCYGAPLPLPPERRNRDDREFRKRCLVWVLIFAPGRCAELREAIAATEAQIATNESTIASVTDLVSNLEDEATSSARLRRDAIPKPVQQEVWRRDQGRCIQCGSQERLHFDHIIPISKGGSGTARNIQLLCEACNLAKSDSI